MKPADQTVLENFMKSPGLQHLAENILLNLDYQTLEHWGDINQVFKQFLNVTMNNPMFWLKRFIQRGLSKKNQDDWIEAIRMTNDGRVPTNMKKYIVWYLKAYSKNERVVDFDVPCYLNNQDFLLKAPELIESFSCDCANVINKVLKGKIKSFSCNCDEVLKKYLFGTREPPIKFGVLKLSHYRERLIHDAVYTGHPEIIQLFLPLYKYPFLNQKLSGSMWNYEYEDLDPITLAFEYENLEIMKILAPLTDDPCHENFVLFDAAEKGHLEMVKCLAPLTRNPNPHIDGNGGTPISMAAENGFIDIIKILAPLTTTPNDPDENGETPIYKAAEYGYLEIVKYLAPLTKNPNAAERQGKTPIQVAAKAGYIDIIEILAPLTATPNDPDEYGETPIYMAALNGNSDIVRFLAPLTKNPNAPSRSTHNISPIYWAAEFGHMEIVKILAPLTKNPNKPNGYTKYAPSDIAAKYNHMEIAEYLKSFEKPARKRANSVKKSAEKPAKRARMLTRIL